MILLMILGMHLLGMFSGSKFLCSTKTEVIPLLLIFLFGFVSMSNAWMHGEAIEDLVYVFFRTILPISLFISARRQAIKTPYCIKNIIDYYIVISALMSLLGMGMILQWVPVLKLASVISPFNPSIDTSLSLTENFGYYRLTWGASSATAAGGMLALAISMIFIALLDSFHKHKPLLLVCFIVVFTGLIFTFARHSWFTAFVPMCVLIALDRELRNEVINNAQRIILFSFTIIISLGIFIYIKIQSLKDSITNTLLVTEFNTRFGLEGEGISLPWNERIMSIQSMITEFKDFGSIADFILGVGPGNQFLKNKIDTAIPHFGHNFINSFVSYWGVISLIIFLLFFGHIFIRLFKNVSRGKIHNEIELMVARVTILVFLVFIFTLPFDHYYNSYPPMSGVLWLFLGVGSALNYRVKHDNRLSMTLAPVRNATVRALIT